MQNQAQTATLVNSLSQKVADYGLLVKFKLTLTVVFSAVMAYLIAAKAAANWPDAVMLFIGGFLVTGAANALNQVLEREHDLKMTRTANRPVAAARMDVSEAVLVAGLLAFFGVSTLALFNPMTALLGMLSLVGYAFIYTPMKRMTPLAVAVGAVPGALPVLIGAVAFDGKITSLALMLFNIQFLWQFVHFWAIAWLADEDYKNAGFYLLPSQNGEKDKTTGLMSMIFGILLIASSVTGYYMGYTGLLASLFLVALNGYWTFNCWKLYQECSREAARRQMFTSFAHLPLTLLAFLVG